MVLRIRGIAGLFFVKFVVFDPILIKTEGALFN